MTTKPLLQLDTFWPYQVTVLADRIARRTSKIVKEHGLNLSQWRVMAAIAEKAGRTSRDVVSMTPMDKGIVSRATKALLQMGLVRREPSTADGRRIHLYLTSHGATTYRRISPKVEAVIHLADERLSATDQTRLSEGLHELLKVIPDLR